MQSSPSLLQSYSNLESKLIARTDTFDAKLVLEQGDRYPILIMQSVDDLVGFAVVDDAPKLAYSEAYDAFKLLYRENYSDWKQRNLSFVVCPEKVLDVDNDYYNSIELDAYFCRKYVLTSFEHDEEFDNELLRLPFLPIPQEHNGALTRPVSAQTLLQKHGVSSLLARKIVVPGVSAPRTLAEEIKMEVANLPNLEFDKEFEEILDQAPQQNPRLKQLTIENFRAYRDEQKFDLDADVVVLYGPNGLGKTSFFDAIDFACTGRIGRLRTQAKSPAQFIDIARHLDALPDSGSVGLSFYKEARELILSREIGTWNRAHIDEDEHDRAGVIQAFTCSEWGENKPQVANLERLFRATHFFSQSSPELLIDFDQGSELDADVVSRALALDDYTSSSTKISDVVKLLSNERVNLESSVNDNSSKITQLKDEAGRLPNDDSSLSKNRLDDLISNLIEGLSTHTDIQAKAEDATHGALRLWRSQLESFLENSADVISLLGTLEASYDGYQNDVNYEADSKKQLKLLVDEHESKQSLLNQQHIESTKTAELLKQAQSSYLLAKNKLSSLENLAPLQKSYKEASARLIESKTELLKAEADIANLLESQNLLRRAIQESKSKLSEVEGEHKKFSSEKESLIRIEKDLVNWKQSKAELRRHQDLILEKKEQLAALSRKIENLGEEMEKQVSEQVDINAQLKKFAAEQESLTALLDDLEMHVTDENCPACGVKHLSRSDLIERIRGQKKNRPINVENISKRGIDLKFANRARQEQLDRLVADKSSVERAMKAFESKSRELETLIKRVDDQLADKDLAPKSETLEFDIASMVTQLEVKNSELEASENSLKKEVQIAEEKLLKTTAHYEQKVNLRNELNGRIELTQTKINDCDENALALSLPIELPEDMRLSQIKEGEKSSPKWEAEIRRLESLKTSLSESIIHLQSEIAENRTKSDVNEQELERRGKLITDFRSKAFSLFDTEVIEFESIRNKRNAEISNNKVLERLLESAITLERVIDASKRSAVAAEKQAEIREAASTLENEKKELARLKAAIKWGETLERIISAKNANAVSTHVREFGPLTTIIQRRLRPVFGFGSIKMNAIDKAIQVGVERKGKKIKPTDYFSDSQKQILMLSIFLATRLSQTWSGFSPILLDDPVTHFDDMNAFSFVELIRGLTSSAPGKTIHYLYLRREII